MNSKRSSAELWTQERGPCKVTNQTLLWLGLPCGLFSPSCGQLKLKQPEKHLVILRLSLLTRNIKYIGICIIGRRPVTSWLFCFIIWLLLDTKTSQYLNHWNTPPPHNFKRKKPQLECRIKMNNIVDFVKCTV